MIKPLNLFAIFVICIGAFSTRAQQFQPGQQIASVVHTRHVINSTTLGEERTILVRVPFGYERSDQRFPVLVMLDAHPPQNAVMASIVESQAYAGQSPEMIIVGIQNTNRTRDLTPTATDRPASGGGDKFLDFVEKEVLPFVDQNYRTHPYRVFAGHSLGGLTAVYLMISRPNLFDGFIAASPILHWDNDVVIKRAESAFKKGGKWNKKLFLTLGDEPEVLRGVSSFRDLVKRSRPDGLDLRVEHWTDEDHGSVVMRSYLSGLREIFSGWQLRGPISGLAAVESHYEKLSRRFGFTVKPSENLVNQLGYILMRANDLTGAVEAFRKNTVLYPESANVYDSFAESLERSGEMRKALDNYEKAFKIAEKRGEDQLAASARTNYERLKARLDRQ